MRGTLKLTKEDRDWAKKVKERDGWKCVICGENRLLNAHHIIARENKKTKYDIHNGLSLCPTHHFFNRQLSAHNNPLGLFMWLSENRPSQLIYLTEIMKKEILKNGILVPME